jgi:signal transduction histidine kinase
MNENLSIFKKGLLLIGIPLLAQMLFLGVLLKIRADQAEAQRWAIHTKDVMSRAEGAFRLVEEANSDLRAFAVSGDPEFGAAYLRDRERVGPAVGELRDLVSDNPPQQRRLDDVRQKADETLRWLADIHALVMGGNSDLALRRIDELEGKEHVDAMRAALDNFLAVERDLDTGREATLRQAMREENWALALGGALAVASAGALLFAFTRGIGRRLALLAENARRLAAGKELSAPMPGQDEISRLDRVFHDMAAALAQKDRENEMFVYSVSHDLRAPLVNLQGFSQELAVVCADLRALLEKCDLPDGPRRRAATLLDRDAAESIRFIQTAVKRLAGIIDALLRLSRMGRVEYQRQAVDVRAAVARVVESLRDTITRRGAELVLGDLPPAWGDPQALEQLFANLIGNAVNYLDPQRPGRIEVGSRADSAEAPSGWRTYYVRDNGLGIPEAQQDKAFLAFQRLHPEAAPGEGIGLALVRRVVERHGGKVWLESAPGTGSTFFVALPAEPVGEAPAPETTNGRPAAGAAAVLEQK